MNNKVAYNMQPYYSLVAIFFKFTNPNGVVFEWLRVCLIHVFKHMFSVFKQYYTYFHTFFHPHVFSKN